MSFYTQLTSGNNTSIPTQMVFTSSATYVAPANTWLLFTLVGGGGGGGVGMGTQIFTGAGQATGGGAGSVAIKKVYTTAETTFVITVGAAGADAYRTDNGATTGGVGGATSISSSVANVTAGGGGGGLGLAALSALNGGSGGIAVGGDINITGGRGGNIGTFTITTDTADTSGEATGGGAVNLFLADGSGASDEITRGGDISPQSPLAEIYISTGGGGIGGRGGDRGTVAVSSVTGGGGSGGRAVDNSTTGGTNSIPQYFSPDSNVISFAQNIPGHFISGVGRAGNSYLTGEPGAATGGFINTSTIATITSGIFAGSGGLCGPQTTAEAGDAILGGGGGGCAGSRTASGSARRSGNGGKGIVFLQILGS